MRKNVFLVLVVTVMITSCQNQVKVVPVDLAAEKTSISALLDKSANAMNAKDAGTILSLFTDDILYCGTDPGEFWTRTELSDIMPQSFADPAMEVNYKIDRREIRVSKDGRSAVTTEQGFLKFISEKIPLRIIYHLVKNDATWQIDFCSVSFIPKNEDIARLNKALE